MPSLSVADAKAADDDIQLEDYMSDDERKEVMDEYKRQILENSEIDLSENAELQEMSKELDKRVETQAEKEEKEKGSKTVYQYKKEQPDPEEVVPRIWLRP